jgi:DNA-binding MarR family transcriptional regulator
MVVDRKYFVCNILVGWQVLPDVGNTRMGTASPSELNAQEQILIALRRIARSMDLRSRLLLQGHGLTTPQLMTLRAIGRLQPATAGAIARAIHLGHSTTTGILDRLERRGWICRSRDEHDRRSVNLCLTARGREVLERAPAQIDDRFRERLERVPQWEQTQILATLQRVADMMDATHSDALPALADGWLGPTPDSGSGEHQESLY